MVSPARKVVPVTGAVIVAAGRWLGAARLTVTAADVTTAPLSSVARAESTKLPAVVGVHVALYGAEASLPNAVVPAKNSTCVTRPSASAAVAVTGIAVPCTNVAPPAGDVIATV